MFVHHISLLVYVLTILCLPHATVLAPSNPEVLLNVGSQLQLFLDDWLIESMTGLKLKLHSPTPAEIVLRKDKPWEDPVMYDPIVIKDGVRYRMWYRTNFNTPPFYTGYAESEDAVQWTKPSLHLIDFKGSKDNNLVWTSGPDRRRGCVLSVFKDDNPKTPDDQRYKAIAVGHDTKTILALVSPDGIRWRFVQTEPILREPEENSMFDSHNIAFWDATRGQYVAYLRGWLGGWPNGTRCLRRSVSTDFRTWSTPEFLDLGDSAPEHLYKNAATPYYRRPDILLMFPKRFFPKRTGDPKWVDRGLSDIVFMFSRDGLRWDRRFMEAFLRPGPDPLNWHERAIEVGPGLVPTGPGEMSLFYMEHYRTDSVRIRRAVLREDGLVSVHAKYGGGSLVTRPLVFKGNYLHLNFSTSAAGSIRVELQNAAGQPIPGRTLASCPEIYGDEVDHLVTWKPTSDLGQLAGQPVRLHIHLRDADLYALQFRSGPRP